MSNFQRALAFSVAMLLPLAADAATYVAPTPPDSVILRGLPGRDPSYDIFLSKRTPDEIRAFYAQLGPLSSQTHSAYEVATRPVLTYQQVADILIARHRDVTLADDLRVSIQWKPQANGQENCSGNFFRELNAISRIRHREAEFEALCKQYGYLQNAYFQRVPDPHRAGRWVDADEAILARAHEIHGGQQVASLNENAAQTAERLAQLALSGQGAEANALAARFTQQATQTADSVADWNAWVAVLKEGDAMGYRTWVLVPTHPSTW
jgi:hypothetical protein